MSQTSIKINLTALFSAIFLIIINFYLLSSLILIEVAGSLIYENTTPEATSFKSNLDYRQQFTTTKSGNKIDLKFFNYQGNEENYEEKVYLYFHGNTGRLPYIIEGIAEHGNVLTPAYPGYNQSTGKPSEKVIYETVEASMNFLFQSGYEEKDIVILGHSLGGSPAMYAATKYSDLDRVILVNTFYSIQKMCQLDYSILCIFGGNIHNSAKYAKKAKARIRHFHNQKDEQIPFKQGEKLHEKIASNDKKFFNDISGTHGDFVVEEVLRK